MSWAALALSVLGLAALVAFQLSSSPTLQRSTVQTDVASQITELVVQDPEADLVEVDARFTRADIPGQDTLLAVVHVQPAGDGDLDELEQRLGAELSAAMTERHDVVALVTVTAIPRP